MQKKVALYGVFITLALVAGYLEMLVPVSVGIPGIKLGLANLVTIVVLQIMGAKDAIFISLLRIILSGILFGNMAAILYSLAGGICSLMIMILLKKTGWFSMIGISIAGGVFHNIGQILVAMAVVENTKMVYYLPVLLISGLTAGVLIGMIGTEVAKRLPSSLFH